MQVAIIPADPARELAFHNIQEGDGYLEALQELVGGDIQVVSLKPYSMTMYVNEYGKLEGLPANARATVLANWAEAVRRDDIIKGDVVLTGPLNRAGNDTAIVDNHKWWLYRFDEVQRTAIAQGAGN